MDEALAVGAAPDPYETAGVDRSHQPGDVAAIALAINGRQPQDGQPELMLRGDMHGTLLAGQLTRCIGPGRMARRILVDSVGLGTAVHGH